MILKNFKITLNLYFINDILLIVMFMKRKIISSTYLRDVEEYQIKIYLDNSDYYLSVKKLISVREKFIIINNLCVMDNGYYVVEVVPKYENYALRVFFDDKKNPLEYYFDISKNNGLLNDIKVPFYDDLYLDITCLYTGLIRVLDEDELLENFKESDISSKELDMIYQIKDKLIDEIKHKTNKYMNIDFKKYLNDF